MRSSRSYYSRSVEPEVVREHLAALVGSPPFARSSRLQRFLEFIVECELAGQRRDIQEYTIGLEVFDRPESFDPRSDSIVRVEAYRLRNRLKKYYAGDGRRAPIEIVLPRRGYVPSFRHRSVPPNWLKRSGKALVAVGIVGLIGYAIYSGLRDSAVAMPPPLALEAFEKGRTSFNQWTGEGARQAEVFFQEAIAHDPQFARAHAWLSAAYRQQAIMGDADFRQAYAKASEAARKAVAVDPGLAEAHMMLAINLTFEPRWRDSEASFRTAIRIEPDNADIYHAYGIVLLAASESRLADAEAELRSAVRLEPGDLAHGVVLAKILYFQGRMNEALVVLEEALRIDPHNPDAMRNLAAVLLQTGEYGDAIEHLETAQVLAYLPWGDGLLGHAFALSGDHPHARALLADLESRYAERSIASLAIATIQIGLEQWEPACKSLLQAWTNREFRIRYVDVDPLYAPMRHRPCFQDLVDQMSLAELDSGR